MSFEQNQVCEAEVAACRIGVAGGGGAQESGVNWRLLLAGKFCCLVLLQGKTDLACATNASNDGARRAAVWPSGASGGRGVAELAAVKKGKQKKISRENK